MKTIKKMMNYQNLKIEEIKEAAQAFVLASVGMLTAYAVIWFAYIIG